MTTAAMPAPGPHGGDAERVAAALGVAVEDILDLSASMNPLAPPAEAVVVRHAGAVARYPDLTRAGAAMAEALSVDRDRVLVTNGGAEAIALVAAELGGHVVEPEFALHPRTGSGPRWRSNPHNPSGRLAAADDRAAGVWDEAFYALSTGEWTRGDADRGAVVVGSLTKLFACPGLRLGYVLADPDLVARLRSKQPTWSVNGIAAAALPDLLAGADLPRWAAGIAELRLALTTLLDRHGLCPHPADAPWVMCHRGRGLRERLGPHGVLVRDCTSFGLPERARVAVPDEAGLVRLARALEVTA